MVWPRFPRAGDPGSIPGNGNQGSLATFSFAKFCPAQSSRPQHLAVLPATHCPVYLAALASVSSTTPRCAPMADRHLPSLHRDAAACMKIYVDKWQHGAHGAVPDPSRTESNPVAPIPEKELPQTICRELEQLAFYLRQCRERGQNPQEGEVKYMMQRLQAVCKHWCHAVWKDVHTLAVEMTSLGSYIALFQNMGEPYLEAEEYEYLGQQHDLLRRVVTFLNFVQTNRPANLPVD